MKTKKYWLRGGIKGIVIGIVLNIVAMIAGFALLLLPPIFGNILSFLFPMSSMLWIFMPQTLIIPFIIYFLIGALIGWHKGKKKDKENSLVGATMK